MMKSQTKYRGSATPKGSLAETAEAMFRKKAELAKLESEVAALRGHLVESLGIGVHDVGGYSVTIDERERLSFDQKAMVESFGEHAMAPFAKLTRFVTCAVTPVASDEE